MAQITDKAYTERRLAVKKLYYCTTAEDVEKVFSDNAVTDPLMKKDMLRECMEFDEIYNVREEKPLSPEDEYGYELAIFLEGSWRLVI